MTEHMLLHIALLTLIMSSTTIVQFTMQMTDTHTMGSLKLTKRLSRRFVSWFSKVFYLVSSLAAVIFPVRVLFIPCDCIVVILTVQSILLF